MPELKTLITVLECLGHDCKKCPYRYGFYDDSGDYGFWTCDTMRVEEESLFFLKFYQYLIEEKENE